MKKVYVVKYGYEEAGECRVIAESVDEASEIMMHRLDNMHFLREGRMTYVVKNVLDVEEGESA